MAVERVVVALEQQLDELLLPPALEQRHELSGEASPQSLLEEGVLSMEQGRVTLSRSFAEVAVPDRIQDVLMARLAGPPAASSEGALR